MKKGIFTITDNVSVAESVLRLTLEGDTSHITAPGQFVNIELDGLYLRRPLSVCDWEEGRLTVIYKIVGTGTAALSRMGAGGRLDSQPGLGNGCDLSKRGDPPL
jgi:dihydroorotate dehydrogenase electron transfer subunit